MQKLTNKMVQVGVLKPSKLTFWGVCVVALGIGYLAISYLPLESLSVSLEMFPLFVGCVVGGMVVLILVHEALHGLAFWLCGGKPSFGMRWKYLAAYTTCREQLFTIRQFIIVVLAPQALTLVLLVTALAGWAWAGLLWAFAVVNIVGGVWDFYIVVWLVLKRQYHGFLAEDTKTGLKIYSETGNYGDIAEGG